MIAVAFVMNMAMLSRGHVMTFPFRNTPSGHAKPRAAVNVKACAYEALEKNATVSYQFCHKCESYLRNPVVHVSYF